MNSKQVLKKRNIHFIAFIVLISLILVAVILVAVFLDEPLRSILNLSFLVVTLIVALIYRKLLYTYNNLAKIAKLILKQSLPLSYTKNVIDSPQLLMGNGFSRYVDANSFVIYYKHSPNDVVSKVGFRKIYKLEIAIVIRNNKLDFYDAKIEEEIRKLESTFDKKERPTKYIIIGYKNYDKIDDDAKKELSEVVCYSIARFHYSQINVGFCKEDSRAYFLYSDEYNPSTYYKQGVDFVKKIIGKQRDIYMGDPLKNK